MRKLIATLLIVGQLISLSPAWGARLRPDSLQEEEGTQELQSLVSPRLTPSSPKDFDSLPPTWFLSASQVPESSRPALGTLWQIEMTSKRFFRWILWRDLPAHLVALPLIGHHNLKGGAPSSQKRVWISGEGIPLLQEGVLKRTRAAHQFLESTAYATLRGIHLAFTGLLVSQLIYAAENNQSFGEVLKILWEGDSNSIRDFYGVIQDIPHVQALFAIACAPVLWGLLRAAIEAKTTTFPNIDSLLEEEREARSFSFSHRSFFSSLWHDSIRWILPCHTTSNRQEAFRKSLLWDGNLQALKRDEIKHVLFDAFARARGYSRLTLLDTLASLANSVSFQNLTRLELSSQDRASCLTLKAEALDALRQERESLRQSWRNSSKLLKLFSLITPLYAGSLLWALGDPEQRISERFVFGGLTLGLAAGQFFVFKTLIEGIIQILNCPSPVGQTWTGPAPWASDYTYACFQAYMDGFNKISGQPPETLTDLFPKFHFTPEEAANFTFALAGNGITDANVIATIFRNFTATHPEVTVTTFNVSGNGFGGPVDKAPAPDTSSLIASLFLYLPHIKILDLSKNGIGDQGDTGTQDIGNSLRYLTSLISLNLGYNPIGHQGDNGTQAIGESLRSLTALTELNMGNTEIGTLASGGTQTIGASLRYASLLKTLNLENTHIGSSSVLGLQAIGDSLKGLTALTALDMSGNSIGDQGDTGTQAIGDSLKGLTALTALDMSSNSIGDQGDTGTQAIGDSLKGLTALTSLNLGSNLIGSQGDMGAQAIGESLRSLTALACLDLSRNLIGSTSNTSWPLLVTNIFSLTRLRTLNLIQSTNPDILPPFSIIQELRTFWQGHGEIADFLKFVSPEELTHYLTLLPPFIRTLNLSGLFYNIEDPNGALIVASFLPSFTTLQVLDLSGNMMGMYNDTGIIALGEALSHNIALNVLSMSNNVIGRSSKGITTLANSLSNLTALTSLDLRSNYIGYQETNATKALASSLATLTKLTFLDLGSNSIGDSEEGIALGVALRQLTKLTALNLENNWLGSENDVGIQEIGHSLKYLTELLSLNLKSISMELSGDSGVQVVAEALRSLTALTSLDLGENQIGLQGDAGTLALAESLPSLTDLKSLSLMYNLIGYTGPAGPAAILNSLPTLFAHNLTQVNLEGIANVTWTQTANAFEILTSRQLESQCKAALCHGGNLDSTPSARRRSSPGLLLSLLEESEDAPLTPPVTSSAASLKPPSLLSLPLYALRFLPDLLSQDKEVEPFIDIRLPEDAFLSITPPRESLRIKRSHALSSGEEETRTVFSSPQLPSYPAHTAVAGGVGLLLLGKGFYDVGKALTQVGRNLWALAVQKYTGQSPEGFLLSGDMRDRKLSKVNALFTSLLEKSRTERYQDTIWAWWLEDHQDEWHRLQRLTFLSRHVLKTFKRKLKQFAQDWGVFEQSQQATSSQEPA